MSWESRSCGVRAMHSMMSPSRGGWLHKGGPGGLADRRARPSREWLELSGMKRSGALRSDLSAESPGTGAAGWRSLRSRSVTIRLSVDRDRWWAHVTDVAESVEGLVPVVKGNG